MANTRVFSAATAPAPAPVAPQPAGLPSPRHRLRAVQQDEVAQELVPSIDVADYLPPGATWLPAPQHTLPSLPGRPPMVGYLVLVPAEPQSAAPESPAAARADVIRIDSVQRVAEVAGRQLDLTYLEFELLAHLVAHPQRVHSRDSLVQTVWGYGHVGDGRTVDVHVARLRRKLGAEYRDAIQTVRRVGYKYTPPRAG
ncbi:winged helix-turn-helix domain-containing protein [Streptomyces indicus]|uniref:Transcriptional regulatory protein, C terminal n=1 Tax=Streptomyces indicus TaxID=417292 RepID=A0A1G8YNH3_9ACTN|nr:winged helix-turn-helix domain-containing protein [Streptomyces indicus]SDK04399.1 Transcriptional regulatory protein, C terminal [Streptomyces indicus]